MTRPRPVYYMDYSDDLGLSGLTGMVCSRVGLRIDAQVVLSVAEQLVTEQEDQQLGTDVRLLLDAPLSEGAPAGCVVGRYARVLRPDRGRRRDAAVAATHLGRLPTPGR
ncbi:hypothetical protein GCM10010289_59460 [Streptomyces violascens]|nr:hypothetical protein GCM10010289_59460 [Streptomyces violascens]